MDVAGPGYRKALEFLVKDFCISMHPVEADSIKKKFLAPCIEEYISDSRIKECAHRATWLGNDETHYERRWGEKDIKDLKTLIRLVTNSIDNELLSKKYIAEMPAKT